MRRIFLLFYYYVQSICPGVYAQSKMGKYSILFKGVEQCDDPGTNEIEFIKPVLSAMGNGNYEVRTNLSLHTEITEDISVKADSSVWGNGGWKQNFLNYEDPSACLALHKYVPELSEILLEQFHAKDCPIPEGYYVIDLPINGLEVPAFPSAPYGKYRTECKFLRKETVIGCIRGVFDIVPKRREKKKKA